MNILALASLIVCLDVTTDIETPHLTVLGLETNSIRLEWKGGTTADSIQIRRFVNGVKEKTFTLNPNKLPKASYAQEPGVEYLRWSDTNVMSNFKYSYQVRIVNEDKKSVWSNLLSVQKN